MSRNFGGAAKAFKPGKIFPLEIYSFLYTPSALAVSAVMASNKQAHAGDLSNKDGNPESVDPPCETKVSDETLAEALEDAKLAEAARDAAKRTADAKEAAAIESRKRKAALLVLRDRAKRAKTEMA